jgi:hypothetical protein
MPFPQFDRYQVRMEPLSTRANKTSIEQDHVSPDATPPELPDASRRLLEQVTDRIRQARVNDRPVVAAFGAHTIKNGLGPVLLKLVERGWLTHLATNGAGIIHDWEFAFQGQSSEDVKSMVDQGRFGNWEETGLYINLALNIGAFEGKGYGESIGSMIENEGLTIPDDSCIQAAMQGGNQNPDTAAAAADLKLVLDQWNQSGRARLLEPGWLDIPHPWKRFSIQAGAHRLGVPFTGHPMIGHDIIYNHPMNHGAALGRTAQRDFLTYAESISRIDGGVYLSIGSAVMSPMIFEKSLSISQNLAIQRGEHMDDHFILVSDLAESTWDWSQGEPPIDNPAYYLRYNKSFSRMGGTMRYLQADNRDLLLSLLHMLGSP